MSDMWGKKQGNNPNLDGTESLVSATVQAEQEYAAAQRQEQQAEEVVRMLTTTRLRNGFAPAIEASIRRKLGGQT